jgi:hypothetical protein
MNSLSLKEALKKLEVHNANHWTAEGLPRIETLQFLTANTGLTREIVNEFAGFNRTTAATFFNAETEVVTIPAPPVDGENIGGFVENEAEQDAAFSGETEKVIADDEIELRDEIASSDQEIELLISGIDSTKKRLIELTQLVSIKREQLAKIVGIETTQDAISSYLNRQKENLQKRGSRLKMIADSGINLKDLAHDLKAPIDIKPKKRRAR